MNTIKAHYTNEIIINKSKFLTHIKPIENEEDAKTFIAKIKKDHYNATHNCYAYIVGNITRISDDGEPAKTAGVPMLEVLYHHQLTNVVVVVTRYFGGIKLGGGGLIRAYSKSVAQVLIECEIIEIIKKVILNIQCAQKHITVIKKIIETNKLIIIESEFSNQVMYKLEVPITKIDEIKTEIINYDHTIIIKGEL